MSDERSPTTASRSCDYVAWLVALIGLGLAVQLLTQYWPVADHLWFSLDHDRHVHYLQGLTIGMSIRHGDVASLFRQLERLQVWGILHPFSEGFVQLVAGPNVKLAVLPSLIGWVATGLFAFLLARRMVPQTGTLGGLFAATLAFLSPAHRSYATDIMLESLGAALSLAVLYCYLALVQDNTRRTARWLAISWTLLFFHKSNYWVLITASLILAEAWRQRAVLFAFARTHRASLFPVLIKQLKHPLTWLILIPATLGLYVWKIGPLKIPLGSSSYEIKGFQNLMYGAFVAFCIRMALWYRAGGKAWLATWPANERLIVTSHVLALSIWFLIPKRLGAFLWFISPANNSQKVEHYGPFYGGQFYTNAFTTDYLTERWLLWPILGLAIIVLALWRRTRPGTIAVLLFLAIATTLTMHHPMLKNRHMHSWAAIYYVVAGAGLALLFDVLAQWSRRVAWGMGLVVLLSFAGYQHSAWLSAGHSQEGNPRLGLPLFYEITDCYQPHLVHGEKVLIVCSVTECYGYQWVYLEHGGRPRDLRLDIPGYNRGSQHPDTVRQWLAKNAPQKIVLIHIPERTPFWDGNPIISLEPVFTVLREQGEYTAQQTWTLARGERVELWQRK